MWKYTASPVNIDIQIWKVFRWKKWINASDNKMGYGSEGSLVLKHHDHKRHFSNKDLEVPHISYSTSAPLTISFQKLFEEAAERRKHPFTSLSAQPKHVTTSPLTASSPQPGGLQILPANRNVSDIVKLMDTAHTGYLTVMVHSLIMSFYNLNLICRR